jgi:hypothetical protein
MKINSYITSVLLAIFGAGCIALPVTFTSKNDVVQNSYCASLESPNLIESIKPTIRRDCIGELDRYVWGKTFFTLLPILLAIFVSFNYHYEKK